VAFTDAAGDAFVHNPLTDETLPLAAHALVQAVLWDAADPAVLALCLKDSFVTCVLAWQTADGPAVASVASSRRPGDSIPLVLRDGAVTCAASAAARPVLLASHDAMLGSDTRKRFTQFVALNKLAGARSLWIVLQLVLTATAQRRGSVCCRCASRPHSASA
jgi:hypothetical protein